MTAPAREIVRFDFEGHAVRSVTEDGAPWFVGKDVCEALGHKKCRNALQRLAVDETREINLNTAHIEGANNGKRSARGNPNVLIVSEPGVYRLVFTSRVPRAEAFKRWLAHEVLPELRRNGSYALPGMCGDQALPVVISEDTQQALTLVREARMLYGRAKARALWARLPLPDIPEIAENAARNEAAAFARDCLDHADGDRVRADRMYRCYCRWAAEQRHPPENQTNFGRMMTSLGYARRKSGRVWYQNVRLKDIF